eukprot:9793509-Alexandrium_andersonii.AAC.1
MQGYATRHTSNVKCLGPRAQCPEANDQRPACLVCRADCLAWRLFSSGLVPSGLASLSRAGV